MNVVGPVWKCPIVAYGPGNSALDHTPDERISLSEYLRSIEILKSMLRTLMSTS
jgi:LysW-gamma-L-lysine carboxypeptidase